MLKAIIEGIVGQNSLI